MTPGQEFTARKHWITYSLPALLFLTGCFLMTEAGFWKVLGLLLIIYNALRIFFLTTVKWRLTSSALYITKGILPWKRLQMQVPIFNIYDASVSYGVLGYFLGYGHITIRGTEGVTTYTFERCLTGAKKFSEQINLVAWKHKENKHHAIADYQPTGRGIVEELKHLSELKNNGSITQEEYDRLKLKLINNS